ncbi:MAG: serine hydrolase [Longicatena sp.]
MLVKKIGCILLCLLLETSLIHGESYVVMSDSDNTILEAKNKDKQQSVASISKIMSAIIAIEEGNLQDSWKCSDEIRKAQGSSVYLKVGQDVTLKDLLYGLMLRSGNDAANEIANHIGKSQQGFVKMMNDKASEIGMRNTLFSNPSGLDESDAGNVSTAQDMAILMSYAMKNATFRKIVSTKSYTSTWNYHWVNKNKLLDENPFVIGGKTGYTKKAGRTLVSVAKNDNVESIVVTLQQENDFAFHDQKHREVFQNVHVVDVLKPGTYSINKKSVNVNRPIQVTLKKDGSDTLQVCSHFEKNEYIVEVQKNHELQVYSFLAKKNKQGWLARLFP